MKVATAQKRLRGAKGSINRTHGSDTYDHAGFRKALRSLSRALIEEQLLDLEPENDEVARMDAYMQDLEEEIRQETWEDMDRIEAESGMKFESEGHYHQYITFQDWLARWDGPN